VLLFSSVIVFGFSTNVTVFYHGCVLLYCTAVAYIYSMICIVLLVCPCDEKEQEFVPLFA
jgi:hypothetical protein